MSIEIDNKRYPILRAIQMEVVNQCNFRCPLCPSLLKDWVPRTRMAFDDMQRIIEPVAEDLQGIDLFGMRGEPFINPELEDMVGWLRKATTAKLVISTNGSLLTPDRGQRILDAGLDQIVFAVDGMSQESFSSYRIGGDLDTVTKNIQSFCQLKQAGKYKTRIIFQFIPMTSNAHEISRIPQFAYELGVDIVKAKFSTSISRSEHFQLNSDNHELHRQDALAFECPFGAHKAYIDPNGYVYSCCYAEGIEALLVGNALSGLPEVWQSQDMRPFKEPFVRKKGYHDFCEETCRGALRKKKYLIRRADIHDGEWQKP